MTALAPVRAERGYSLVELLVYIVVLGIISTIVATVIVSLFRTEQTVSSISSTSNDTQLFSTVFARDVHNARAATLGGGGASVTLQVASSSTPLCWRDVTWAFQGDEIARTAPGTAAQGHELSPSSGAFTVTGRTVAYSFTVPGPGGSAQPVTGSAVLGPAGTGGTVCS